MSSVQIPYASESETAEHINGAAIAMVAGAIGHCQKLGYRRDELEIVLDDGYLISLYLHGRRVFLVDFGISPDQDALSLDGIWMEQVAKKPWYRRALTFWKKKG